MTAEENTMPTKLERITQIKPAYDCLVVQPCVHGSEKCGTVPGYSHGRHNAEMRMTLRSPVAEILLAVGTGWCLRETPYQFRLHDDVPRGLCVEFHSAVPQYVGHERQESQCALWPVCYWDVAYAMADAPARLLVSQGSDAVWEWLEATYRERFDDLAPA